MSTCPMHSIHSLSVDPLDYKALSTTLIFTACETRRCLNVTIVDDMTVERNETLDVALNFPGLDFDANQVAKIITILDNDGKITLDMLNISHL